ncbi:hypothetical protein KCU81_g7987, partial [Aureobasidium melanogenum]|uniref:Uncharacterized protein n=1 Tax=Aureobasidium melanogenum (strain CBS 110374) TaxID=1043003 RepID=A0A074VUS3_AURM1
MLYAYFTAVIRYIQVTPGPPSIERTITNRTKLSVSVYPRVEKGTPSRNKTMAYSSVPAWTQEHHVHTRRQEEEMSYVHNKSFDSNQNKSADRNQRQRLQATKTVESTESNHLNDESHEEDHTTSSRFSLTETASIIDLTASDSEESLRCEPDMVPDLPPANHVDRHPIPLAKQKLLDKLQNRKAHEIEDMLVKRAGLIPDWIEKTMREEMERKMARDLEAIENWL